MPGGAVGLNAVAGAEDRVIEGVEGFQPELYGPAFLNLEPAL